MIQKQVVYENQDGELDKAGEAVPALGIPLLLPAEMPLAFGLFCFYHRRCSSCSNGPEGISLRGTDG